MTPPVKKYESLEDALARFGIPQPNRPFVRKFVEAIGIAEFYETTGYIKAVRIAAGPDLHIASGWSNGFVSEAEILGVLGDVSRWGDDERPRVWGVGHPENRIGHGGGGPASSKERDYGTCVACFTAFSANGMCGCS
jgi:hypothetical protein